MRETKKLENLFLSDIVIFGGLGDLSIRKILPAIYYRLQAKQLADECKVILISRQDINKKEFEDLLRSKLEERHYRCVKKRFKPLNFNL